MLQIYVNSLLINHKLKNIAINHIPMSAQIN